MSAATPEQVREMVREIHRLADEALDSYEALYESGYQRQTANRSTKRGRSLAGLDALAASTSTIRGRLDEISGHVRSARDSLRGSASQIEKLKRYIDEQIERSHFTDPVSERELPRDITKGEHRAIQRQQRRHNNGWQEGNGKMPWHRTASDS